MVEHPLGSSDPPARMVLVAASLLAASLAAHPCRHRCNRRNLSAVPGRLGRDAGVALLVLFMALKPMEMGSPARCHRGRHARPLSAADPLFLLPEHPDRHLADGHRNTGDRNADPHLRRFSTSRRRRSLRGRAACPGGSGHVDPGPLFPRVSGPLWGLPQDAHGSCSGLPETISPGSISDLVLNGNIAFRAHFDGATPANSNLYWRGPVMDEIPRLGLATCVA